MTTIDVRPRRPIRLAFACLALVLIGVPMILLSGYMLLEEPSESSKFTFGGGLYLLPDPMGPWLLAALGALQIVAGYLAGFQRRYWLVMAITATCVGVWFGLGFGVGSFGLSAANAVALVLVASARRAFVD